MAVEAARKKYPAVPDYALPKIKYNDTTANGLTACIVDFIRFNGGYAVRINTQGQYKENIGKWVKGSTTKGTADVHAVVNGKHLSIEVKIGRDRQSEAQKQTEERIIQAGGLYFIARDLPSFIKWFYEKFPSCRQR